LPIVCAAIILISCCRSSTQKKHAEGNDKPAESQYLYGLCIDTLAIENGTVGRNQYLSNILLDKGVGYPVIDHIATKHKGIFDVSKIRNGNKYTFLATNDSLHTPLFWIYEIDYRDYAIFALTDSLNAWRGQKPVDTVIERATGTISSSLWNAITESGSDPYLSVKLSEIYAWTIDFFGIQKGDSFDAIYERLYVEEKPVGFGRILCCNFIHRNDPIMAFCFDQDNKEDYFDENGVNLRKAFLKAPLNYSRISSKFSNNRYHPVLKISRPHHGVDYAAPSGTPVFSIGDGVVIKKAYQKGGGGNYLKIKHNSTYTTVYMHLKGYAKGISEGTRVKQGQLIGYVGSTGIATGPHLDFRVFKNGTPIDPLKMQSPPAEPVRSGNKYRFQKEVDYWMKAFKEKGVPQAYKETKAIDSTQVNPIAGK
jgi:Membrane proteins related to metalloendopeptidases